MAYANHLTDYIIIDAAFRGCYVQMVPIFHTMMLKLDVSAFLMFVYDVMT